MPDKGVKRSPLDYALRVLSRRRVSKGQMRDSMRRKGYPEEDVENALLKLCEWGYLDDAGFARDILQSAISGCPLGRRRAEFELSKRLFDKELIASAVDDTYQEVREEELASLAAKKYLDGKVSGPVKEKERERLARWLQRRGFDSESIYSVLRSLEWGDRE